MRKWASLMFLLALAGCATTPVQQGAQPLAHAESVFNDQFFAAATERIDARDVFALDDRMKRYLSTDIAAQLHEKGSQQGLFDALYTQGQLKLDYEATITRNAAQAFAARSGNCLSLVILTASLAKRLGLIVRYQLVYVDDAWSRSDGIDFFDEHVNVTLGAKAAVGRMGHIQENEMTIDFLTPNDIGSLRTRVISEETVAAMYMNNRAAEAIARQQLDNAYGWAHAAIVQDPHYLPSYNTLGIIYKRHGNPRQAEQLFKRILAIEPENTIAMSNLVLVLSEQGRTAEAGDFAQKLKRIRPYPPFHFFDLGMAAMQQNNFAVAKAMFAREVEREAYYDKFHFWLALAYYQLGDLRNARKHLVIAEQTSTTSSAHALYAAKLARLRSAHVP